MTIPPEERASLTTEAAGTSTALAQLEAFDITDAAGLAWAEDALVACSSRLKEVEARRTSITKPLLASKRAVDDLFAPLLGPLKDVEKVLRARIGAYTAAQVRAQAPAMEALAAGVPGAALVIPPSHAGGISVKAVWRFRVTDPELVPRELCSPDDRKIAQSIWYADTPHKAPHAVPGLEFYLDGQVTVRT